MRKALFLLFVSLPTGQLAPALAAPAAGQEAAKSVQASQPSAAQASPAAAPAVTLRNEDVLGMLRAKLAPAVVSAKIGASACDFDTSPDELRRLKAEGVPDEIILAMVMAHRSAPASAGAAAAALRPAASRQLVPEGTTVELETIYNISSQEVRAGDAVSFRVVNPVRVAGVTVVETGATATARIVKASRGGHFGRAGRLAWEIHEVTAVDGTRLPLQFAGRVVGDSKGAKVATQMVVMGALLWPIAPVVLFHGFKRGENAYIPAGKRFEVFTRRSTEVTIAGPR